MSKIALLFTGQGSQFSGMGKDFCEKYSAAKAVFDKFNEVIGKNIAELSFNGSDDDLKQTINAQPCILAMEIAALEALKSELKIEIAYAAGHSLGEYAALYAAGVIDIETAAKLINARANAMSKVSSGAMSAIIGLSDELLQEVLKEASEVGYVDAANYNTPEQTVITGEDVAVAKANELALAKGAKRALPLAVSGAFHSKLMSEAAQEFQQFSSVVTLTDAKYPVITNVDAQETILADDFREKMPAQIYSSVRWVQTLNYLKSQGVDTFIEVGPAKILTGMVRKTLKDVNATAICTVADLEKLVSEYKVEV